MEIALIPQPNQIAPSTTAGAITPQTCHEASSSAHLTDMLVAKLADDKAEDVLAIDLVGKSSVADTMIIASGRSQRHVGALAEHLSSALKKTGMKSVCVEGMPACDWVLIDAGDVIVHLFHPEVRNFYSLERIWAPELFDANTQTTEA